MNGSSKALLGIALLGGLLTSPGFADEGTAGAAPTAQVQTAAAEIRDVAQTLPAYGSVGTAPGQQRSIAALRNSEVDAVDVVAGAAVHEGAVLMTLRATPDAYAAYTQARSAADAAHAALAQAERLFAGHLVTNSELAAARQAAADADANLKAQDAMGGAAMVSKVLAPSAGVVGSIAVHVGDRVTANTPLLTFSSTHPLYAQLGIAPEDAGRVKPGMAATVQAVFSPAARGGGKVEQVGATLDGASGLVEVLVKLSGGTGLVPGVPVSGDLVLAKVRGPAVPRSAVLNDAEGAYLFVVRAGKAHRVDVKTGPDDGKYIAVTSGIKAGDKVVTLGNYELDDGMAVEEQSR